MYTSYSTVYVWCSGGIYWSAAFPLIKNCENLFGFKHHVRKPRNGHAPPRHRTFFIWWNNYQPFWSTHLLPSSTTGEGTAHRIYISVIEGTAPAIVLQRFYSLNLFPPALSDGQVMQYTADRVGRGWVSQILVRRWHVLSLLSVMYTLWGSCTENRKSMN